MAATREHTSSEEGPGLAAVLGFSLACGLLLGTVFGVWEVRTHAPRIPAADRLLVVALDCVAALVLFVPLVLTTVLALRLVSLRPGRGQWAGLQVAAGLVALVAAVLLLGSLNVRRWLSVVVLLASLPAALLVYGAFARIPALGRRGVPAALVLATTAGVLALGVLPSWLRAPAGADAAGAPPRRADGPPNVVLVVLDTTRRDHLGCYGNQEGLTPRLDEVAAGGVVFEDAYSASNWTVPSHASILTGLPPVTHGCSRAGRLWLDDDLVTLAEKLSAEGYDTAALYSNPWLGRTNLLQGFDARVDVMGRFHQLAVVRACIAWGLPSSWIDKGAAQAAASLEAWLGSRRSGAPFFVFVNLLEAHTPYLPPREERRAYLPEGVDLNEATHFARTFQPRLHHLERSRDERATGIIGGLYRGGVKYQDRRLGELLDVVARFSAVEDTLLVVTADHGENINDDGRWDHEFDSNDTLIHIPLVVRYPRAFPPGTRVAGLCELLDLAPTIEALAGVEPAPGSGSLRPDSFVAKEAVHSQMYPLYNDFGPATSGPLASRPGVLPQFGAHWRVLRTERWKLLWSSDGEHRLFDVQADPLETRNVAAEHGDVVAELGARLNGWWNAQPAFVPSAGREGEGGVVDEEALEKLRTLGYVR